MKRHVATSLHQLALIEARVRDISIGLQPLPPPPCPTPWTESLQTPGSVYSGSRSTSPAPGPSDASPPPDLGNPGPVSRPHPDPLGMPMHSVRYTESAADRDGLERDPNFDTADDLNGKQMQSEEAALAAILNEDVMRELSGTYIMLLYHFIYDILSSLLDIPVWMPDNTVPFKPPNVDKDTYPWPDRNVCDTYFIF
jgi:hypothetical protein